MKNRPDIELNRRRLLGLAGLGAAGVLTWDVARAAGDVEVAGPETRPDASDEAIEAYVRGCTDFGVDLLTELSGADPDRNVMLSPLGLSSALAMTWAGARGETERRMAETLHLPHGQDRLHPAIGALQYDLDRRGAGVQHREIPQVWNVNRFELRLANALWGQANYPFAESFLDTLERNYGSDLQSVDFDSEAAAARRQINDWGRRASGGRVTELVGPEAIDRFTVFVVTNAVSLRADWAQPFDPDDTDPGGFARPDGSTVEVPMMHQEGEFPFLWQRGDEAPGGEEDAGGDEDAGGVGFRAVELPYVGRNLSMVLFVPDRDRSLAELEAVVDAAWLESRFGALDEDRPGEVSVTMPRFTFGNDLELTDPLKALGMSTAFDGRDANFGGMTDPPGAADGLHLDWVFHDTHVAVDEEGTVAVAVSAVGGEQVSAPPSITLDRPFLFCIRDRPTDAVLFLGRVVDPGGK